MKIAYVFLCILSLLASISEVMANPVDLEAIRFGNTRLRKLFAEYRWGSNDKPIEDTVTILDNQIRETIRELFEQQQNFEEIKALTKEVFTWSEWPANITMTDRISMIKDKEEKIRINYHYYKPRIGTDIYLLNNSFLGEKGFSRVEPGMYTIMITNKKVTLSDFAESYPISLTGLYSPPCFLGFTHREGNIPKALVLYGPHGSGAFMKIYLYSYHETENVWKPEVVHERPAVRDYSYDEEKAEFKYQAMVYSETTNSEKLKEIIYRTTP